MFQSHFRSSRTRHCWFVITMTFLYPREVELVYFLWHVFFYLKKETCRNSNILYTIFFTYAWRSLSLNNEGSRTRHKYCVAENPLISASLTLTPVAERLARKLFQRLWSVAIWTLNLSHALTDFATNNTLQNLFGYFTDTTLSANATAISSSLYANLDEQQQWFTIDSLIEILVTRYYA